MADLLNRYGGWPINRDTNFGVGKRNDYGEFSELMSSRGTWLGVLDELVSGVAERNPLFTEALLAKDIVNSSLQT